MVSHSDVLFSLVYCDTVYDDAHPTTCVMSYLEICGSISYSQRRDDVVLVLNSDFLGFLKNLGF